MCVRLSKAKTLRIQQLTYTCSRMPLKWSDAPKRVRFVVISRPKGYLVSGVICLCFL